MVQPFHSYVPGGSTLDKFFPDVAVFPHRDFNTNYGFISDQKKVKRKLIRTMERIKAKEIELSEANSEKWVAHDVLEPSRSIDEIKLKEIFQAQYIFHAAGRCDKVNSLRHIIEQRGLMSLCSDIEF
jgi:hypothetical protein